MVKGNWERRAEIATLRRQEERAKKEERRALKDQQKEGAKDGAIEGKLLKPANGEAVHARLLRDDGLRSSGAQVSVWLAKRPDASTATSKIGEEGKRCSAKLCLEKSSSGAAEETTSIICRAWFRADACENKKCKLAHAGENLWLLRGVCYSAEDRQWEEAYEPPVSLEELERKDYDRVRLVAVDRVVVYDYYYPDVWQQWIATRPKKPRTASDGGTSGEEGLAGGVGSRHKGMQTIAEEIKEIETEQASCANQGCCLRYNKESEIKSTTFSLFGAEALSNEVFKSTVLRMCNEILSEKDCIQLHQCSKCLRKLLLQDSTFRVRKKEAFARVASEVSKAKKQEKKKRAKQANVKVSGKKDGFARGGNSC